MHTIYICNSMEDIATFIKMFPEACWSNEALLSIDNDFNLYKQPSVALYKLPNTNSVTWSTVHDAEEHIRFSSSSYVLGKLSPVLSYSNIFTTFLKHHDAYEAFEVNYQNDTDPALSTHTKDIVSSAFVWEYSKETISYWGSIDNKWRKLVRDLQLPNERINNFYTQLFIIDGETNDNT